MRKSIIKQAKTKDEAIRRALAEISRTRSEVDIEVIDEGSSGFLGFGSKDAVVRITYEEDIDEAILDIENEIKMDTVMGPEFDREYNIKDRSDYYKEKASANYDQEFIKEDTNDDDYIRQGAEFEQKISDIKNEDKELDNDVRLQKIDSFEENSTDESKEPEDLSKTLDQRLDNIEEKELNEDFTSSGENSKDVNIEDKSVLFTKFDDEEELDKDNKLKEKTTFESSASDDGNLADDFKADDKVYDIAYDKQQTDIDKYYKSKEFLEEILKQMHFENVSVYGNLDGACIKLDAKVDEKDTGIAIGKGGSTLDAIEFIIRKSIDSRANNLRVNVDINNYKKRRDDKIKELAADTARKVAKSKKPWNLKYMNSYERRLAHEEISKHPNVASHSEGQDPKRYVVVDYVFEDEE